MHPQFLPGQPMQVLRVVCGIGEQACQRHQLNRGLHARSKTGGVIARPQPHIHSGDQVAAGLAASREFGPSLMPGFPMAGLAVEVEADQPALESGGIDRPVRVPGNQAASTRRGENPLLERLKAPFSRRRRWA